jgi:5'-methylthioadenosine phosphorylase
LRKPVIGRQQIWRDEAKNLAMIFYRSRLFVKLFLEKVLIKIFMIKIGIIGGSGLDDPQILKETEKKAVVTKYGLPSSILTCGKIGGIEVVILARHGKKHSIPPSQVNYRANIQALADEGCTHILAATAVGSLREEIKPGNLVFPDQFIDFTKRRENTFFTEEVRHTPMAEPFDKELRNLLVQTCEELGYDYNRDKAVITIEGPRFSSPAESRMFRQWGADIINMSTCPEVILANELGIPYQTIAMSTDYDCWKDDEEPVTFEIVMKRMAENAEKVKQLLIKVIPRIHPIKSRIRTVPHWPKTGVMFRDITTLIKDPEGLKLCLDDFYRRYKDKNIDLIVGIDSRGFIIGGALAHLLGKGFVPVRKKGKLPAATESETYALEYGNDTIEIHQDAIEPGQKVVIIDDLCATGGTALAASRLVKKLGGEVMELAFIVDLPDLGGSKKLLEVGLNYYSQTVFEGE